MKKSDLFVMVFVGVIMIFVAAYFMAVAVICRDVQTIMSAILISFAYIAIIIDVAKSHIK